MIYMAIVSIILCVRFSKSRAEILSQQKSEPVEQVEQVAPVEEPLQGTKIKHVLVPTDGSGQAFKALLKAVQIAEFYEARITLLMCVEFEKEVSAFEQVSLSGYVPADLNIAAHEFLSDLMEVVPSDIKVKTRVEIGEPGETIVDFAKYEKCDVIVMGEKGFGSFEKKDIGSISHYVKENSPCPVVLVEGMPDDWAEEDSFLPKK